MKELEITITKVDNGYIATASNPNRYKDNEPYKFNKIFGSLEDALEYAKEYFDG